MLILKPSLDCPWCCKLGLSWPKATDTEPNETAAIVKMKITIGLGEKVPLLARRQLLSLDGALQMDDPKMLVISSP